MLRMMAKSITTKKDYAARGGMQKNEKKMKKFFIQHVKGTVSPPAVEQEDSNPPSLGVCPFSLILIFLAFFKLML